MKIALIGYGKMGKAIVTVMEDDLIPILENVLEQNFQLGKDVGLISYNETPIKRLLFSGISTISTDFELMGQTAADLIKSNSKQQIENPFNLITRSSI